MVEEFYQQPLRRAVPLVPHTQCGVGWTQPLTLVARGTPSRQDRDIEKGKGGVSLQC